MKKFISALVILLVLVTNVDGANIDSQIKTQKKNQADIKKKIDQYNAVAKEKSKQSKTLLSQLSRLKRDANNSQNQINNLEQENNKLANSVSRLNKDIAGVNASMEVILSTLKNRLLDIYKFTPDENTISIILSAKEPHDAINTAYLLQRFAKQDAAIFEELNKQESHLISARTELEANKNKIDAQTTELKKQQAEYDSAVKKTDTLLKNVQNEQKKAEAAAKELENAQKAVGSKINSLMKQKNTKKTSTKTQTKITTAKVTTVQGSKATVPVKTTSTVPSGGVKTLSWPVNGQVTMQYGSRVHPTFKTKIFNSGIDIKAASGTPVKAAGPGEVLYQGWLRGFGQVVIIDHGGNISTVYAHLSGTSVREGANVKTGTVIGRVGNSGTDSQYGLHFEVRKNGSAVNPMNYLRK